ncbi:hypothetical protein PC128_g7192 [Phytophthora cactorum]|nr:hypothetical protein PC120_g9863 [Phytophthora cactorum]KAG3058617.1 hypothetical protein PC121_g14299 [Phytophthora cactorum]KAG3196999.1 hypothetical protein PC128_g7192 [Phytophthora cactorum]KAG4047674.1 hypothetical protein PC123_g16971 [Phytophthora cactorum]
MYHFISDVNANRIAGSTGKPEWFDLSKKEKRELRQRHRIKSPNLSQDVYEEMDLFLSKQPDTEPLASMYSARARYDEEDVTDEPTSPGDVNTLFGDDPSDASGAKPSKDPLNTVRKKNKKKRGNKYDEMREILQERSEVLFERTEKLQKEELNERRKQHAYQMALIREFVGTDEERWRYLKWQTEAALFKYIFLFFNEPLAI